MTPEQALIILDQAGAMAPVNRASHDQIRQAIMVIKQLIEEMHGKRP